MPDYLIDADTSVKSRVEVAIHGRILDVKYTQILMKLSQPESFASCPAGSGAETPETHSGSIQMAQGRKTGRRTRAQLLHLSQGGGMDRAEGALHRNRGWMISKDIH